MYFVHLGRSYNTLSPVVQRDIALSISTIQHMESCRVGVPIVRYISFLSLNSGYNPFTIT